MPQAFPPSSERRRMRKGASTGELVRETLGIALVQFRMHLPVSAMCSLSDATSLDLVDHHLLRALLAEGTEQKHYLPASKTDAGKAPQIMS